MTQWRVTVDARRCQGSGVCTGTAPDQFRLVDERSVPVTELTDPVDPVLLAAESCPVEAITVRDTATGRTLAPEQ